MPDEEQIAANLAALTSAADREIEAAGARKTSFEARALGIFTLALGVPTLYLLIRDPLELLGRAGELLPHSAMVVGFAAAALALTAAIVVAWPVKVSVIGPVEIRRLHKKVTKDVWIEGLLLNERVDVLEHANQLNKVKGVALVFSLLLTLVSVLALGMATVGALPASP